MKVYPKSASQACIEEILSQMKKSIGTIYKVDGKTELGKGYFCHIKYEKRNIPVIIINNLELYKEEIDTIIFTNKSVLKKIKLEGIKIKSNKFKITVFEIKENKREEIHFLEIDERLYKKEQEYLFNKESIYILQYFDIENIQVSSGIINIDNNNSEFDYSGNENSKGSLIFNLSNNKIIGICNDKKSRLFFIL